MLFSELDNPKIARAHFLMSCGRQACQNSCHVIFGHRTPGCPLMGIPSTILQTTGVHLVESETWKMGNRSRLELRLMLCVGVAGDEL